MPNDAAVMFHDGDRALVIGVGRSGMATAAVLRDRGLSVTAYDDKAPDQLTAQRADLARIRVELVGPDALRRASEGASIAILSPGVPFNNPAVLEVRRAGVQVISEIEAAYRIATAPIIAITGSKGKSTTTALTGHLLRAAGFRARVGGNIGNPLILETAAASADEWIVAEVSSFQLEGISTFRPRVSALLNLTPDHLDRYPSLEEYREAKYRIFANQGAGDSFIGNAADGNSSALRSGADRRIPCPAFWFAADERSDVAMSLAGEKIVWRGSDAAAIPLLDVAQLRIRGTHNVANAMAASLAALLAGAPIEAVREGLRSFEAMPHRLQLVADTHGIRWIDDSKASNPDAVVKALQSFDAPIILIAGGRSKKTDFAEMAKAASQRAKLVVLIGESAREIAALIERGPIVFAQSMEAAVAAAAETAARGDVVLLSPGCASFDMFESAEQRGDAFAAAVAQRVNAGASR